ISSPAPVTITPKVTLAIAPSSIPEPTVMPGPTASQRPTPTAPPSIEIFGQVDRDVTYCNAGAVALKMDIYYPLKVTNRPAPVALNVHGGSWSGGDKRSSETMSDIPELLKRGYLVAAVNYRLAPEYKFPAQIQDVKCAVRYLRTRAVKYKLDPNRIGAWGCSAGGKLAALLGLTDGIAEFEGREDYIGQSSRVQAVVAMSAPADFTLTSYNSTHDRVFEHVFGATSNTDPILTHFSPVTYVSKNAPPFLILGGDLDATVPLQQSEELARRLIQAGGTADLEIVNYAHHCMPDASPPMEPSREEITRLIANFFDQTLGPPLSGENPNGVGRETFPPFIRDIQGDLRSRDVAHR
ncbi:MAG TPA: alpha/beta hydrolase, partial [Anaerolineae bacterium]